MQHDLNTLAGIMAAAKEVNDAAKNAGLEFFFDISLHHQSFDMFISKGLGPGCQYIWKGCIMADLSAEKIGAKLEKAMLEIEGYNADQATTLEKDVADLAEQLKNKRAALRKVKKEDTK